MRRKYEFRIDGKAWQWLYKSLKRRGLHGLCNYDEKTVTICSTMSGIDRLDTEIHEAIHALQGYASEEHVAEVASTLAGILWEIGYRLPGEHDA